MPSPSRRSVRSTRWCGRRCGRRSTGSPTAADRGWQPAELHRVVARRGDPSEARLVVDALAARLADERVVDPRWREQAAELGAEVWWSGSGEHRARPADPDGDIFTDSGRGDGPVHHLRAAAARWRVDRVALLDSALALLRTLRTLPPIDVLIPPPGRVAAAPADDADPRLLNRVRNLLAKAEATAFPAEAEAYTAKAQELIARYSLDAALAASAQVSDVVPFAQRIGVDHPYESEKASLLDAVARANRCHTVWSPELGFSTVFGFEADLAAAELVYTSLLVQSHRAMTAAEPRTGKSRIKAFRRSFLIAYAVRIGERLESVTAAAALTAGGNVLPVLASRDAQVRETMDRAFPRTVRSRGFRVDSDEGWHSGREAADRARLA
jgi:hypothetical protein